MLIWEKRYPRDCNMPDPKLSKEHLLRFNRVNKLLIAHNLFSLIVHIQRKAKYSRSENKPLAQGTHYRQQVVHI